MSAETLKLGQVITDPDAPPRDAVHVAVVRATAGEVLRPGIKVGLMDGRAVNYNVPHLGVVDPFLTVPVLVGQEFWLWLFPGTITSLRHDWTHPAFDAVLAGERGEGSRG